jgi:hypothetical protein
MRRLCGCVPFFEKKICNTSCQPKKEVMAGCKWSNATPKAVVLVCKKRESPMYEYHAFLMDNNVSFLEDKSGAVSGGQTSLEVVSCKHQTVHGLIPWIGETSQAA